MHSSALYQSNPVHLSPTHYTQLPETLTNSKPTRAYHVNLAEPTPTRRSNYYFQQPDSLATPMALISCSCVASCSRCSTCSSLQSSPSRDCTWHDCWSWTWMWRLMTMLKIPLLRLMETLLPGKMLTPVCVTWTPIRNRTSGRPNLFGDQRNPCPVWVRGSQLEASNQHFPCIMSNIDWVTYRIVCTCCSTHDRMSTRPPRMSRSTDSMLFCFSASCTIPWCWVLGYSGSKSSYHPWS